MLALGPKQNRFEGGASCQASKLGSDRADMVLCLFLLQMTGLDIEKDQIIEMACLITDSDLNILAEVGEVMRSWQTVENSLEMSKSSPPPILLFKTNSQGSTDF